MQKKSLLIVILLLATALLAQTHTYPSTDSNATITGQWTFTMPTTFLQLTGSTSPLAAAPACSASGTYWLAPIGGTVNAWQFCGNGILYNLSSGGGGFTAGGDLSGSSIDQVVVGIQGNPIGSLAVGCLQWTGSAVIWGSCGSSFITSLTTTGTSGPATVSSGVLNIPQYSGGSSFNPASPGPIGGTTPSTVAATTVTAQSVNGLLNPLNFAGSDIGAQINAAAASCTSGSPCNIVIPPNGTLNFATTITYVPNETISCTEEGSGSGAHTVLNYTGSGIAINFNGANTPVLKGCSIQPGNATEAVHVSGYNPKVVDTIFQGGIAGSKVVHVTAAQQAQIVGSSFYGFSGDALYVDNSVDTNIDGNYHYAYYSGGVNHTSRDLVLDTAADGTTINAWKGGNSGLHGFVMQSTLTGSAPANVFAHDLESDCSYGDTWYFDPSLAGSEVLFTAIDSWASGAGQDCTSAHNIINSSANGVHISGGDSIHISGSFRASANDGILLDQATLSGDETADISITDSKIYDNNFANNSTGSGIVASYTLNGLRIQNNTITDTIEIGGNQKYGVVVSGASNTDLIVTGNNLDGNATGPENITYSQGMIVDHNSNGSTLANAVPVYTDGVSQQAGDSASVIRSLVNVHSAATVQTDSVTFPNLTAGQIGQRFFGTGLSNNNSAVETFDNVGAGSSSNSYCLNMYGSAYSLCINAANISWNGVPLNLSLTTTGTSGAATLTSGVLNIPQYSSGSGVSQIIAGTNVTISPSGGTGTVTINSTSTASTAFSAITGSTNTTAAMVVGTGASLATSGTGTIAATSAPYSGLTGTVPTWNQSTTGNAATATSATTATNVAGGLADELLYQTGVGATGFVTGGTGVLYQSSSGSAPIITNAPYVTANANPSDQSSQAANDLFVTRQINLTMGTTPLAVTGGTYSFDSQGTGATFNYSVTGGVITTINSWTAVGSGYAVGDIITPAAGNYDAMIRVTAVNGSNQPTAGTILYGGTGYSAGTAVGESATNSIEFTFLLSGTLTSNATFVMTNGTYLTQSNQWIFANNTTGGYTVTVCVAGATDACAAGGRTVVVPQGTNNSAEMLLQTDGELNVDLGDQFTAARVQSAVSGQTGCSTVGYAWSPQSNTCIATGSGLSGMTATQVPIAASATTVASSEALAGSGAGITTGPVSGTTAGHLATFVGTNGQIQDGGAPAAAQVAANLASSGSTGVTGSLPTTQLSGTLQAAQEPAHTGDMNNTAGSLATTVVGLNGTSLAGLATGLVKNTTGTGVPSIAVSGTDYAAPQPNIVDESGSWSASNTQNLYQYTGTSAGTMTLPASPVSNASWVVYGGAGAVTVAPNGVTLYVSSDIGATKTAQSTVAYPAGQSFTVVYNSTLTAYIASPPLVAGTGMTIGNSYSGITFSSSGGGGGTSFPVTYNSGSTYQVLAADFASCKLLSFSGGPTVTLVASTSQPASGQCVIIANTSTSFTLTVSPSGQQINGSSSNVTLQPGVNAAYNELWVVSDGTNYTAQPIYGTALLSTGGTTYGLMHGNLYLNSNYVYFGGSSTAPYFSSATGFIGMGGYTFLTDNASSIGSSSTAAKAIYSRTFDSSATQTKVACSTSGYVTFSQPFAGNSYNEVAIAVGYNGTTAAACLGTASYTYPYSFSLLPDVEGGAAALATSVSTTAVTITGTTSTGWVYLKGY